MWAAKRNLKRKEIGTYEPALEKNREDIEALRAAFRSADADLEERQRAHENALTLLREAKKRLGTPPPRK